TTAYNGTVNSSGNTSLTSRLATNGPVFISASQLYLDLTDASDHLPVVADYTIPMPAPVITDVQLGGTNLTFAVTNGITNATYAVLMTTNLAAPRTDWTTVATFTANSGAFTFTATNTADAAPARFFTLQGM
ncbi:MAG TPA: hypothetical protein VIK53_05100, partial [Verrucomicrobiae bacterium]